MRTRATREFILLWLFEGKHLTTYIFRHTHISMLAELGVPLKTIMQRVGHNDPNTTLSIYTHVTKSMHDDVIICSNCSIPTISATI